ncbi:hypothetical protein EJ110_NYTH13083 [Nymphaea thermarum]|nr:hypothetical protein EJ110_NYTH13083 [Nymphaea thermarum]
MKMRVAASSKVRIWIRLLNLPLFMWNERTLDDIAMVMDARLVGMDHCTKRMDKHNFARILVEVPPGFIPTSEIPLAFEDGKRVMQTMEYKEKVNFCSMCGSTTHNTTTCVSRKEGNTQHDCEKERWSTVKVFKRQGKRYQTNMPNNKANENKFNILKSEDLKAPSNAAPMGPMTTSPAIFETTHAHHQALAENHRSSHHASGECPEEVNSHIGAQGDGGKNQTKLNIQGTIATPPASQIDAQAAPEMPQKAIFAFVVENKKSRKRRSGGTNKRTQNNVDGFVSKKRVQEEQQDEGSMTIDVQMLKVVNATAHEAMPKLVVIDTDQDMAIDPGGGAPKRDGHTNSDGSQHGEGMGKETMPMGAVEPNHHEMDALGEKDWLFFIKDNHQRSNSHGVWQSCGANEAVRNATQERIGTKSKFRYYVGNQPTGWFITEYYLDKDYRARANIPERSVDYILCKVEFVGGQQISNSSAAGPSTRVKEETASN